MTSSCPGAGQLHVEVTVEKLKRKYRCGSRSKAPKVPYRETITAKADAQGRLKKQSGGRGQFGDTWIRIEPLPRGKGFEFSDEIKGGAIPRQYIPSVEKGVRAALTKVSWLGIPWWTCASRFTTGHIMRWILRISRFRSPARLGCRMRSKRPDP